MLRQPDNSSAGTARIHHSQPGEWGPQERAQLLQAAHDSIRAALEGLDFPLDAPSPHLSERRGVFTTLYLGEELRGCVGYVFPVMPIYQAVAENATKKGAWSAFLGAIPASEVVVTGADYREHLLAKDLNPRCRAILELMTAEPWFGNGNATIYAAEAVTPFALLLRGRYARFIGSEYASTEEARDALFPIPFQDLENLTFPSDRFDCVVTNDCLEHVANVRQCLAEMCRVLRPGGVMLSTFPFTFYYESEVRARLVDGRIEHLLEPEYHGNPAEPASGSLVFEIPGWNILGTAKDAGFARAELVFVSGMKRAITGAEVGGIFVLRCYRG